MVTSSYDPQTIVTLVSFDGNMNGDMNGNILIRPPDNGNIGFLDGNVNGNMNGNMNGK